MNNGAKQGERFKNPGLEQNFFDACAETAAGIGHELNNPLAIIRGHAQNLLKNETSEEKRRRLAAIVEQTARAYEMIVDLRTFARPPKPSPTEVDVKKFCDEWARREAKRCEENDVRLEVAFEFAENAPTLTTDEAMLAAILNALTKNAVEATGAGGATRIFAREVVKSSEDAVEGENDVSALKNEASAENGASEQKTNAPRPTGERWLEIGVEDDGPGLSAEAQSRLFAPYFSGREAGRGLGVGLAKARRWAETLGIDWRCEKSFSFESGVCWRLYLRF